MGLFSTEYRYHVNTQVQRVVEDKLIPDVVKKAVFASVFKEDATIMSELMDSGLNGSHRLFEKMYRYADGGEYHFGLPDAKILDYTDGVPTANAVLLALVGEPITIEYMHFRPLNRVHVAWAALHASYGYDSLSNEITTLSPSKPGPVYLDKIVAVYKRADGGNIESESIGSFEEPATGGGTPERPSWKGTGALVPAQEVRIGPNEVQSAEIHYVWVESVTAAGVKTLGRDVIVLPLPDILQGEEYYQAKYTIDSTGAVEYWAYNPSDSLHPSLDGIFDPPEFYDAGTFFPFAVLKSNDTDWTTDEKIGTPAYDTTEKLLSYIGIDFAEVGEGLRDNAEYDIIKQTAIMMGVPFATENQIELQYLYEFFSAQYDKIAGETTNTGNFDVNEYNALGRGYLDNPAIRPTRAIQIADGGYEMAIKFSRINKTYTMGSVCPVGTFLSSNAEIEEANFTLGIVQEISGGNPHTPVEIQQVRSFFFQQSSNVYIEIQVHSPKARYKIDANLDYVAGLESDSFLVPIDRDVARLIPSHKRTELYQRSLHFVFNSLEVQEIKWYQKTWFSFVLTVVAVVLTVYSLGTSAPIIAAAASGAGALAIALIQFFLTAIIKSAVFQLAFTELARELGVDAVVWIAAALIAVGGYKAFKAGGIVAGSTAANLLIVANGMVSGASNYVSEMIEDIMDEMGKFNLLAEAKSEELREAQESLESGIKLNPMTFIGRTPTFIPGERVDDFFARSAHSGNIGAKSLNIIQNYCSYSLRLPKVSETTGQI